MEENKSFQFSTIEEALDDLRAGKIILCTDDPDRENEGDFICAAQIATTENVNFMAVHGKGLICMPKSAELCQKLAFPQMVTENTDNHETAFTVSIDHVSTTTGISAAERAITALKCVDDDAKPGDFRRPGHMFPLVAKPGGVLERNGHTEATVDLMRHAGMKQCGLCCEIMREDGTMMRTSELLELAHEHNLVIVSIKQLQDWCRTHDNHMHEQACVQLPCEYGTFEAHGFVNDITGEEHVALVKGDLGDGRDVLCRVHSECLTGDVFGSKRCDCGEQLHAALAAIEAEGRGVLLYMRQEGRGIGLMNKLRAYELQERGMATVEADEALGCGEIFAPGPGQALRVMTGAPVPAACDCVVRQEDTAQGMDTVEANEALGFAPDLREYWSGAQILRNLGCKSLRLLTNNPDKVYGLSGFNLEISERVPIEMEPQEHDRRYLQTKAHRMGHLLEHVED